MAMAIGCVGENLLVSSNKIERPLPKVVYRGNFQRTGVFPSNGLKKPIKLLWQLNTHPNFAGWDDAWLGERIAPQIHNNKLFLPSLGTHPSTIDILSGLQIQQYRNIFKSTAIGKSVIYARNIKGQLSEIHLNSGKQSRIFATINWGVADLESNALYQNVLYAFGGDYHGSNGLHAINVDSSAEMWSFPAEPSELAFENGVIYGVLSLRSGEMMLYALDSETGTEKWSFKTDSKVYGPAAVANNSVYFGSKDYFFAIDTKSGMQKWKTKISDNMTQYENPTAVAVDDKLVYLFSSMWTNGSYLIALDARTGEEHWRFNKGVSDISPTPPSIAGNLVIFGDYNNLIALDKNTGQKEWQKQVIKSESESPIVSEIVIVNDIIMFGGWKAYYAYK